MVAEFESDLIRLRTREGMKVAKAKGRLRGQQPKLNHRQEAHLVTLFKGGEYSTAELADLSAWPAPTSIAPVSESELARARSSARLADWLRRPAGRPCGTATSSWLRRLSDTARGSPTEVRRILRGGRT